MLSKLDAHEEIDLRVVAGSPDAASGHAYDSEGYSFTRLELGATKNALSKSPKAIWRIMQHIRFFRPDAVLMPMELKHASVIVPLAMLKKIYGFRLVSYNHSLEPRNPQQNRGRLRRTMMQCLARRYDHVVFYSQASCDRSVAAKFVIAEDSSFAENTLDVESIRDGYDLRTQLGVPPTILFIGRLLPQKGVTKLFDYYTEIKKRLPELRLEIIGDGPMRDFVSNITDADNSISWQGAVSVESEIRAVMERSDIVMIPGETGLGVVHAFAYGKPYVTVDLPEINHGPEFDYLVDSENGFRLTGIVEDDAQ
ncbi:MAG: glycosyltransferase family 4 protein, partial [Rubripirellula sp.]